MTPLNDHDNIEPSSIPEKARRSKVRRFVLWLLGGAVVLAVLGGVTWHRLTPWRAEWRSTEPAGDYRGGPRHGVDAAFSPDGSRLAVLWRNGAATVYRVDGMQRLCSIDPGAEAHLENYDSPDRLQWSRDGSKILVNGHALGVYDAKTGEPAIDPMSFNAYRMALSPDGRWLATASAEFVEVYDVENDTWRQGWGAGRVWGLSWVDDEGRRLLGVTRQLRCWSVPDDRLLYTIRELDLVQEEPPFTAGDDTGLEGPETPPRPETPGDGGEPHVSIKPWAHLSWPVTYSLSPDRGQLLVGFGDPEDSIRPSAKRLRLYDMRDGSLLWDRPMEDWVTAVCFSRSGRQFAALTTHEAAIHVFDTASRKRLRRLPLGRAAGSSWWLAWSHNDMRLILGRRTPAVVDAATGELLARFDNEKRHYRVAAVSPACDRLVLITGETFGLDDEDGVVLLMARRAPDAARPAWARPEPWALGAAAVVYLVGLVAIVRGR